jgi:hypothetical protein
MAELYAPDGEAVSSLLTMFQNEGSFPFYADAEGVVGTVWFDCKFNYKPRRDGSEYTNTDEWIVLAGAVILTSGPLWGVRAIRLRPGENAIDVLGKDPSDEEYNLLDSFQGIQNVVTPD